MEENFKVRYIYPLSKEWCLSSGKSDRFLGIYIGNRIAKGTK